MRFHRLFLEFLALWLCAWPLSVDAGAPYSKYQIADASHVRHEMVYIGHGVSVVETSNLSTGGDTYLHVNYADGTAAGNDDDSGGGLASRVVIDSSQSSTGWIDIYVRSYSGTSTGTCDLTVTKGQSTILSRAGIFFGGSRLNVQNGMQTGDAAHTVHVQDAVHDTVLYGIDYSNNIRVIDDDGGTGYLSTIEAPVALAKVIVGTYYPSLMGATELIINDKRNDSDGDGLGPEIESALCSCDNAGTPTCGVSCSEHVRNLQDSDGDGVLDQYEVLGRERIYYGDDFPQHLPMWGANPARKDLFLELDRRPTIPAGGLNPAHLTALFALFGAGPALHLHNRDGSDGIALHIDNGTVGGGTQYGNWGGHNAHNESWETPSERNFVASRRGIFRYAVVGTTCCGVSYGVPTSNIRVQDFEYQWGLAHELGHALGLWHGGSLQATDLNGKPNYVSLMNYAFDYSGSPNRAFSAGTQPTLSMRSLCEANGLSSSTEPTFLTAGRHEYQSQSSGPYWGIDWNRDGTISSCTENVSASVIWQTHQAATPEMGRLRMERDTNTLFKEPDADPNASPATTRMWGRTYIAYRIKDPPTGPPSDRIRILYSSTDFSSCPEATIKGGSTPGCGTWNTFDLNVPIDAGTGPLLLPSSHGLIIVWRQSSQLWYQTINQGHTQVRAPIWITADTDVIMEPVGTKTLSGDPLVVYRRGLAGFSGPVWFTSFTGSWTAPSKKYNGSGSALEAVVVTAATRAPDGQGGHRLFLMRVAANSAPFSPAGRRHSLIEIDSNDWTEHDGTNLWNEGAVATHVLPDRRGGLTYREHDHLPGGRLYFLFRGTHTSGNAPLVKLQFTESDGIHGLLKWTKSANLDNHYLETQGGAALAGWEESVASVRSVLLFDNEGDVRLEFRPFVDGIVDVELKDSNDWSVMERGLCAGLHGCTSTICKAAGELTACVGGNGTGQAQSCH